jgi:O-antigen ligase
MFNIIRIIKPENPFVWLPLLAVIALPFGRSVEVFVVIMAIIGGYDLLKNTNELRQSQGFKLFSYFFLCFWIPALVSLFDAVNFSHSSENVLGMLRFYFAAIFIINRLTDYKSHLWLATGIGSVILFWCVDAWLQLATGFNVFGFPPFSPSRISGVFGESARLGLTIIPFLAIAITAYNERINVIAAIFITGLATTTILISGDRSAWISLLALSLLFLTLFRPQAFYFSRKSIFTGLTVIIVGTLLVFNTPQFQTRLNDSLTGLSADYESINTASSSRLPIWETALKMFVDNPINGVGVRSFRYAYPSYANPDDPFIDFSLPKEKQQGQTHAHQLILEFLSDTGLIGLIGYFVAIWLVIAIWRPLSYRIPNQNLSKGYILSLLAILFPINSHLSFFSSSWAQIIWFIAALSISSMTLKDKNQIKEKEKALL